MTTASAPATSSEHRDPLFKNTKNRIASLSNKNEEILDQINKLQHSHSQTLTVINNKLETIPHTNGSGQQHIDNLVNNLKSRQRRSNSLQQQLISSNLRSDKLNNEKDLEDVMEVENNYEINKINETGTITTDDSLSSRKSARLAMANRSVKELKKIESLTPNNNNGGELDWKYFSTENVSDSENDSGMEDRDFENMNDNNSSRRRILKGHPALTINTKTTKSSQQRLITPEDSEDEFDISNAHMPLPTLGSRNPLRATRHSSAEHYSGNITERRGRTANSLFSTDDVIEEEKSSLSDVAEQNEVNTSDRIRSKQLASINGRKRAQKYLDDYNIGGDVPKTIKMHRRPQTDDSYVDIPDDNSSVMSTDSYLQLEDLRARIQKLESERIDDENMSERKSQRRKKQYSDAIISPAALSPDSSQGGTSSITSASRRPSSSAQHQKHLQNAFDMFEKAFTTDHPTNDSSPPPSHSMAMVVSSALSLNQRLRSTMTQMEHDGQLSERGLKALLKTSDEQIRSLTECLLALAPLAPKRASTKKVGERDPLGIKGYPYYPSESTLLQMSTPSHSTTRSNSPIPRTSSAPALAPHESQIGEHVDQPSSRRVSPVPPSDNSSPPNSYYVPSRSTTRYSRVSRSSSPTENYNDSQVSARVLERKSRRSSGAAAYNSYTSVNPVSSSPPSPPIQHIPTHYDQPGPRVYYEREVSREAPRELPRLQRYNNVAPQPASSAYQRTASRPSSIIRTDESFYPHHVRTSSTSSTSSIHRSSSGRSYAPRVTNEEFVNSPVSTIRSQPRLYEYTRRYPSDGQSPIDRRPTPGLETDRRYSRRIVNQYEPEDGYDGPNSYVENISERDYVRDDKVGIRRNISNGNSTYRQRMVPAQEQVNGNEVSRGESNQQDDEINHDDGQNVQVNGLNVENSGENDGYI